MADLEYTRGTTFEFTVNFTPAPGEGDAVTALFTVKTEIDNDITDLENDIMIPKNVAMADNTCNITIEPGDVGMSHEKGGGYVWDVKVLDENGKIFPAVSGKFKLDVTATNRITP